MSDYLLYTITSDRHYDYLYNVQTGEVLDVSRLPTLGTIHSSIAGESLVLNVDSYGAREVQFGFWDLTTGRIETIPTLEDFPYSNQDVVPFGDGYFIAGHEPIFYRPGDGARMLGELNTVTDSFGRGEFSSPENAVPFKDGLIFTADAGLLAGGTLFDIYFQGDPDTTAPVQLRGAEDYGIGRFSYSPDLTDGAQVGDYFVFEGTGNSWVNFGIYATDGTFGSVENLVDGRALGISQFSNFTVVGDYLYFSAEATGFFDRGYSVWRTDGTAEGTEKIANIDTFEQATSLAGLSDDEGGIRGNSVLSPPVEVNGKVYVFVMADTMVRDTMSGSATVNPIRPMVFEILPNGSVRFASEVDTEIRSDFATFDRFFASSDILTSDLHVAGGKILAPGQGEGLFDIALYAIDPETGTTERVLEQLRGPVYEIDIYGTYGDDGLIFFDRGGIPTSDPNIFVTDGTAAGSFIVDNLHDAMVPDGVGQFFAHPDNRTTFFSNEAISWTNNHQLVVTPSAGEQAVVLFDERDTPTVSDTIASRGMFEGPDDLFDTLRDAMEAYAIGGVDADVLTGTAADDIMWGDLGHDTLQGFRGDDLLQGGRGNDVLDGGNGSDTASYEDSFVGVVAFLNGGFTRSVDGNDTLISIENIKGTIRDDFIAGSSAANVLKGGDGNDRLKGNGGNDHLFGGNGDDVLKGGADSEVLEGGHGVDILLGYAGNDVLYGGFGDDFLYGGLDSDTLMGGDGGDMLRGNRGGDVIHGGKGDDQLRGGGNGDVLNGEGGDDFIVGEGGADTLRGGAGNDTMFGGFGGDILDGLRDTFIYVSSADGEGGFDRIRDFENGIDRIDLRSFDFGSFSEVSAIASNRGANLRINFGDGDVVFIDNFTTSQFTVDDVLI